MSSVQQPVLGILDTSKYQDVITGTWADTTSGNGRWSVNDSDVQGLYKPSKKGNSADLYTDINKNGIIDSTDKLVGLAATANISTGGSGTWNWSGAGKLGDYFGSNGQDAGSFAITDKTFRDFITGTNVIFSELGKVESGKIYQGDQIATKSINAMDYWAKDHQQAQFQWQFGKNFIVATEDATKIDGTVRRWVIEGKFAYEKGTISKANINNFYDICMKNDGKLDDYDEGYSASFGSGRNINRPQSIGSWQEQLGNLEGAQYETGNYHGDDAGWSSFATYGSGKFFTSGWELTPFESISGL